MSWNDASPHGFASARMDSVPLVATPIADQVRDALREAGRRALAAGRDRDALHLRQLAHDIDDATALDLRRLLR